MTQSSFSSASASLASASTEGKVDAVSDRTSGKNFSGPDGTASPVFVFVQDRLGKLVSLDWSDANHYGLLPSRLVGHFWGEAFGPTAIAPYQDRVQRILNSQTPEQFDCTFRAGQQRLNLTLLLTPVQVPGSQPQWLMGIAHWGSASVTVQRASTSLTPDPESYRTLLTQITWNIRRTLDLETIWQQTVDGVGAMLNLHRCLVCAHHCDSDTVQVAAEYCRDGSPCWQGQTVTLPSNSALQNVLSSLQPQVIAASPQAPLTWGQTLAVPTCYQDQPNGLLLLHQSSTYEWSPLEIELISELADQVGTAVAHASLFGESQALALQLQRANSDLTHKHQELEEARRQAEEASRLKSEFLANTSHELRTPLNGMIGFLRLVLDGMADDPEEQQDFIREAHGSALHLLSLINDVLDVAKIEAGKLQIELLPVSLKELLQNVENFTQPQAEQKGLAYEIRLPATRDEILLNGNYQRLLQVMLNLVGNAIKFTHDGKITITAEVKPRKVTFQGQDWPGIVKISVADTGIGVSLEKQDRLFQTFSQVDGERTRQYGGTGLGLVISQKLVEAMGGVVQFISMGEGLGSTVTFTALLYQEPVLVSAEPVTALP